MDDSLALFASFYASHVSKDALTHESDSMQRLVIPQAEFDLSKFHEGNNGWLVSNDTTG